MAQRIPTRLSAAAGRTFGLTVGIAFLVLAAVLWWRAQLSLAAIVAVPAAWGARHALAVVFALAGILLAVAALTIPTRLGPVERAWMGLAHAMSRVTTPIVMGVVYFLVLSPIGVVMRLFGKNPIVTDERDGSLWVARDHPSGDMHRQF